MKPQVFLSRCASYEKDTVAQSVENMFFLLGGVEKFITPGDKVFLKINLLTKKKPEEVTTTHPTVVEAVVRKLQDAGGKVVIGDSPGGPYTEGALKAIYNITGMNEVAKKTGCELNFDLRSQTIKTDGRVAKTLEIINPVLEFDKVIAIGKLKTHMFMTATMAVKLCFGYIPGLKKADYHVRMPKQDDFANLLIDIYETRKPDLSIIEAVQGMEGDGPSAGTPIDVGCLIAGTEAHAIDIVGAELMGIPQMSIPTINQAVERGLSPGNLDGVDVIGSSISDFAKAFKNPRVRSIGNFSSVPKPMRKFISNRLQPKPVFNSDKCKGCRDCERACPAKTISIINNKAVVNLDNCIRCFCCHELCLHKAITIKKPMINRIITR